MTTPHRANVGDRRTLRAEFVNADGDPANPTAITWYVLSPSGVLTTADEGDATNPEVGDWRYVTPTFDESGTWSVGVTATGNGTESAAVGEIVVEPNPFPT